GPRYPAAHAELGQHPQRGPAVHQVLPVDHDVLGAGDHAGGAGLQTDGRRLSRPARSAAPRRVVKSPPGRAGPRGEPRLKITRVPPFLVDPGYGKNWLFVKVETSDGLHGWGECYTQADRDHSIAAFVGQLGRYLVGRDAGLIRHFTHWAYH